MKIYSIDPWKTVESDIQQIFDAAETGIFMPSTVSTLKRFHAFMTNIGIINEILANPRGDIGIIEDGSMISLRKSKACYFYCADCGNVTRQTCKVIHASQTHLI